MQDIDLYGLGKDYYLTFAERVNSLRPEDVQKAAQKYLRPDTATIVVLGEAKSIEKEINRLGAVTVLPGVFSIMTMADLDVQVITDENKAASVREMFAQIAPR